jgi:hypothetical protein
MKTRPKRADAVRWWSSLRRILARSVTTTIAAKKDKRPNRSRPSRLHPMRAPPLTDAGATQTFGWGRPDFWSMRPVFGERPVVRNPENSQAIPMLS